MKIKKLLCSAMILGLLVGCGTTEKEKPKDPLQNPKDTEVEKALKTIDGVGAICLATEDNDPNNQLGKKGGYTGAVYFRLRQVDERIATGDVGYAGQMTNDACEDGTTGGGQIEIYANKKDANKRDSYLASFDGTPIGDSHVVKGTIIIRISNYLTASQQEFFTKEITSILSGD